MASLTNPIGQTTLPISPILVPLMSQEIRMLQASPVGPGRLFMFVFAIFMGSSHFLPHGVAVDMYCLMLSFRVSNVCVSGIMFLVKRVLFLLSLTS
jgi:hypothetical protein